MVFSPELKKRAIRLRSTSLASADYALNIGVLGLFHVLGVIPLNVVLIIAAISAVLCITFLSLIGSGKSEYFTDPSLTGWQVSAGCGISLLGILLAPQLIYMFVLNLFVPLAYGSLRFKRMAFVTAWVSVSIALCAVVLLAQDRLDLDLSSPTHLYMFLLVATLTVGRFLFINAEVSRIRQRVANKNRALRRAYGELRDFSQKDSLTGLGDRDSFFRTLREFSHPLLEKDSFHVAVVEIEPLDKIYRNHGPSVGDRVVRSLSDILSCRLRRQDVVTRVERGRFGVILPSTSTVGVRRIFERIQKHVQNSHWHADSIAGELSVSIGICSWHRGEDVMLTWTQAQSMLRAAQMRGRNIIACHERPGSAEAPSTGIPAEMHF